MAAKLNKNPMPEDLSSLFKQALDATAEGVIITETNGDIIWVNPAYEVLTGYSLQEVKGRNPRLLKSGKQDRGFYTDLWETVIAGNVWHGELWNKRKNGELYLEEQSITPVKSDDGKITHFIAIKRDVTNQFQLLNKLNMAQRIEAIAKLTMGVAHNFNNKLASILGYSELAVEEAEQYSNEDLTDYLQEISIAGKSSRDLIRQMMAFSQNEVNEIQSVNIVDILNESVKILNSSLPSSITIITKIEDMPKVQVDPVHLHQMILSLAINASEAMDSKGVITIGVKKQKIIDETCDSCYASVNGDYVVLFIRDEGNGIEPKNIKNIFLPFFTTREMDGGTGMGLSAMHGMLHDQKGHVLVDSAVDKGTEFRLLLPEDLTDSVELNSHNNNETTLLSKDNISIMIIDDEESLANVLAVILRRYDYEVTVETNSKTALKDFSDDPDKYDLLITDKEMPDMDGIELAASIHDIRNDIPIILITGYDSSLNYKEIGNIKSVLTKPFETVELVESIKKLIKI